MPANVAITQDTANPYSESDISINPSNVQQIIAASNANANLLQLPMYWSHDAGVTWTQTLLPTVSTDTLQFDPAVSWTSDGTAWAICNAGTSTPPNILVRSFKSVDGGKTWTYDSDVSGSQTFTDKPSVWVDRSSGSTKDNMYVVWHLGAICYAKSADGGSSFGALTGDQVKIGSTFGSFLIDIPAQAIRFAGSSIGCLIYVTGGAYRKATVNNVYAIWHDLSGEANCTLVTQEPGTNVNSTCKTRIWFNSSNDGGQTWNGAGKTDHSSTA